MEIRNHHQPARSAVGPAPARAGTGRSKVISALSRRKSSATFARTLLAFVATFAACASAQTRENPDRTRLIHAFDFNERGGGNLEDIPRYWTAIRPHGFPHFAAGAFDLEVGRESPPSFYLSSEGRNVAYHYAGPETRVRTNSEYRIEGYIRADRLEHARACLSAHFLDAEGKPLVGTLMRSPYVTGSDGPETWIKFALQLPAAPAQARTVGLIAWVLQEQVWCTEPPLRRHISRRDVNGGAWFDDIFIYAMPRVELTTGVPGNVLADSARRALHIVLADDDDSSLTGKLSITNAAGALVESDVLTTDFGAPAAPALVPVDHLAPGLYQASLSVLTRGGAISSRHLTFAQLASRVRKDAGNAQPFGVVIEPSSRGTVEEELSLLRNVAVRSVKLPVWSGLPQEPATPADRKSNDRLLQALIRDGFDLTGVFFGPPSAIVRADGPYPRPLEELLAGAPSVWREHLAAVVAPYASIYHWWQMGRDGPGADIDLGQLRLAATQLNDAMHDFVTMPLLAAPLHTMSESAAEKIPVRQAAITIAKETSPEWMESQLSSIDSTRYQYRSAFIEPSPKEGFLRLPRIARWAQKVILARHLGFNTVFIPQPWRVRESQGHSVVEPDEEYLVLRTIADVISSAVPGQHINIAPSVRCLAFHDDDTSTLAIWDTDAPLTGRELALQLGEATRQIDLWGAVQPLSKDEHGRQVVRVSPVPILVDGADRSLIELRSSINLVPNRVESGTELAGHTLEIANNSAVIMSGTLTLAAGNDWEVTPRTVSFNLSPRRSVRHAIQIRLPHNEPAGNKTITAKIQVSGRGCYMEVPLLLELGLRDADVRGMAIVEGNNLVLRHVVVNRSADVLLFRGAADVPERARQYRPFSALYPGDSQTVEYRFPNARELKGSKVRLRLREMNDGPRAHSLELIVP